MTIVGSEGKKIFRSANKLFRISSSRPVGIMVYESPYFMGTPWEILIKLYRKELGNKEFSHLKDYAENFILFLKNRVGKYSGSFQDDYYFQYVDFYYKEIQNEIRLMWIDSQWSHRKTAIKNINSKDNNLGEITDLVIDKYLNKCKKAENVTSVESIDVKEIYKEYEKYLEEMIKINFSEFQIDKTQSKKLKLIASYLYLKAGLSEDEPYSGIVIAGFGEDDITPCLESYEIFYFFKNTLKYTNKKSFKIADEVPVDVMTFGQDDMINVFMAGIDPRYIDNLISHLEEEIDKYPTKIIETKRRLSVKNVNKLEIDNLIEEIKKETLENVKKALKEFMKINYIGPTYDTTTRLPKRELAEMAESLVSLMSFKRKLSMQTETVAGPIDVAVISKSDGFIWIKRKHYFKPELNPHYSSEYEY